MSPSRLHPPPPPPPLSTRQSASRRWRRSNQILIGNKPGSSARTVTLGLREARLLFATPLRHAKKKRKEKRGDNGRRSRIINAVGDKQAGRGCDERVSAAPAGRLGLSGSLDNCCAAAARRTLARGSWRAGRSGKHRFAVVSFALGAERERENGGAANLMTRKCL